MSPVDLLIYAAVTYFVSVFAIITALFLISFFVD